MYTLIGGFPGGPWCSSISRSESESTARAGVFAKSFFGATRKIRPNVVLIDGKEQAHPEGRYYIDFLQDGQRKRLAAGPPLLRPRLPLTCRRGDERNRRQQQHHHAAKKHPAATGIENQRVHDAAIQPRSPAFRFVPMLGAGSLARVVASNLNAAQGDSTKATISEKSIAAEAPTGIGRM